MLTTKKPPNIAMSGAQNYSPAVLVLHVLIPKGIYKPHVPKIPVSKGIKPINPHQVLKYTPAAPIKTPRMIRMVLSTFPTFFFMITDFFVQYTNNLQSLFV